MFRYWTLSNIPLFLLATPTLLVLFSSGVWGVQLFGKHSLSEDAHTNAGGDWNLTSIGYRLAITQIALAGMAVFAYHVQVITRLSSSCVVCYWWAAVTIAGDPKGRWIVKGMVVYGLVQGVLFAGFLPPA